jgi:magnesium and cobalt transporter
MMMAALMSSPTLNWFNRVKQTLLSKELKTKQELLDLIRDAQQKEILSPDTLQMVEGSLQVSEMHVRDIMIPRAQVVALEVNEPPEKLVKIVIESGHSRFPVVGENRDDVQGIFLAKDLLDYYATGQQEPFNMRDVMRPAIFIPESKRLNILLREFRTSRNHMAIVIDEYGGMAGLVTIEDVIEQIVGDIDDEHDFEDEVYINPRDNGYYLVWALTPIEEFNFYFETNLDADDMDTVGGLIMKAFGHLPKRGETIEFAGFKFEVMRANNRRIHLLRIKRLEVPQVEQSDS